MRPTCVICNKPLNPGEQRVSWFTTDPGNNIATHGSVHLHCLGKAS